MRTELMKSLPDIIAGLDELSNLIHYDNNEGRKKNGPLRKQDIAVLNWWLDGLTANLKNLYPNLPKGEVK